MSAGFLSPRILSPQAAEIEFYLVVRSLVAIAKSPFSDAKTAGIPGDQNGLVRVTVFAGERLPASNSREGGASLAELPATQ